MASLYMEKTYKAGDACLVPLSDLDRDFLAEVPSEVPVRVRVTRPRSGRHHRLFFGLLHKVVENQNFYKTVDELLTYLKTQLGYVEKIRFHDGKYFLQTMSISFDKMPQDEFRNFFERSVDLIVSEVLPGVSKEDLLREVEEMLGIQHNISTDGREGQDHGGRD
jgi:hypothetical protein